MQGLPGSFESGNASVLERAPQKRQFVIPEVHSVHAVKAFVGGSFSGTAAGPL
jgi:hypothetical protein